MTSQLTAKVKGKRPVFLETFEHPTLSSLIRSDHYGDAQIIRWNEEITYLINVFDAVKYFKDVLQECPEWSVIWDAILEPIKKAAEKATDIAVEEAGNPKSKAFFNEVKEVRNACAVASTKPLNDPFSGKGVITNLVNVMALAETVNMQHLGVRGKAEWEELIFISFRRIWSRIDRLLLSRAKPTTIGFTQEVDIFGRIDPPVFAVSASGDKAAREVIRKHRISLFAWLGMETDGRALGYEVDWEGGSCSEPQNWLTLAPELNNACLRPCRRFFLSSTFKVNDVWKLTDASILFQNVMPFCGNCRALAESLETYDLFVGDGALLLSSSDLRKWVWERSSKFPYSEAASSTGLS